MCLKKFGKQFLENCLDNELCEVEILFLLCRTVVMVMISIHTIDVSFVRFVPNKPRNVPMCCSMKVLSVRGTVLLPILACPLFRISSRTDFRFGNLLARGKKGLFYVLELKRKSPSIIHTNSSTHPQAT